MESKKTMSNTEYKAEKESLCYWAREAGRLGLVRCSSGNISMRLKDGNILISGSGTWLEKLTVDEICVIDARGNPLNQVKVSGEWRLHLEVYKARPDAGAVLHFQSPCATAVACFAEKPNYNVIIEVPVYIGSIVQIPYLMPGSAALAETVAAVIADNNIIQMENHGQVVVAPGLKESIERAVFFELCCEIITKNSNSLKTIPFEALSELKNYRRQRI